MVLFVSMDQIRATNPSGFVGVTQRIVYADGLMFQKVEAASRIHLPIHKHPESQLSFVLQGFIEIHVEKEQNVFEKLECSQGHVFWIPPNALHDANIISETGAAWLSIYSPPRESYKPCAVKLGDIND